MLKVIKLQRQTLKNLNIQWNKKERWNKKISDSKNRRTKVLFFAGRKTLQEISKMSSTEPLNDRRFCRSLKIKMKVFESELFPSLCQAKKESHCKATAIWHCLLSYNEGQLKDISTIHLQQSLIKKYSSEQMHACTCLCFSHKMAVKNHKFRNILFNNSVWWLGEGSLIFNLLQLLFLINKKLN